MTKNVVRVLTAADIPQAMLLKRAAGWNQTEDDWKRLLQLSPDGCFGVEIDGQLASTAVALCYGQDLAWIGMVLTSPDFRGRGLAKVLVEHCVHYLDGCGVRWMKLDATDMGRDLYFKLGFREECPVERWRRSPGPSAPVALNGFTIDPEMDRQAFGADRSDLLRSLATVERVSVSGEGYAMGRPGTEASYFGPCLSRSSEAARQLVQWYLSRHCQEPVYWDLFPDNREAVRLAQEFGFAHTRKLMRMARAGPGAGQMPQADRSITYALAGFEYG